MNKKETAEIMKIIKGAYPRHFQGLSPEEILSAVDVWQSIYEKYTFEKVSNALFAMIRNNDTNFPPAHGAIIKELEGHGKPLGVEQTNSLTKGRNKW